MGTSARLRGEGRGDVGPKSQRRLVSARETPAEVRGEEPRKEKSEKLRDWSELQGEAGKKRSQMHTWLEFKRQLSNFQLQDGISCGSRVP